MCVIIRCQCIHIAYSTHKKGYAGYVVLSIARSQWLHGAKRLQHTLRPLFYRCFARLTGIRRIEAELAVENWIQYSLNPIFKILRAK
jgi:hypothetical protein